MHDLLAPDQTRQVEPERGHVGLQLRFRLLKGHEHARLAKLRRPAHEKFRRQQRLAAAGAAADEGGPAPRQSRRR